MPKYSYTVVNPDNKQLQGTISAPDEESARAELNQLSFSVVALEEVKEEKPAEGEEEIPTFEFGAIDKNQKKVIGTIQSEDRYAAFKRLIAEYQFEVEYVIDNDLSEEKKEKARKKGSVDLYQKYDVEQEATKEKISADEKDIKEFEKKQTVLKAKIEFVLEKVNAMLDEYEAEMKPESKEKLRQQVEKVLRIKNSTNLDYIRNATEELLNFLQKEELFLHEERRVKERTKMVVEAQSMMMQLKKGKDKPSLSIADTIRNWRKEHIADNENPSFLENLLNSFASLVIGKEPDSPEVLELRNRIASVNDQLQQFVVLYFQAPSPEFKKETKEGLKNLWQKRKKLVRQLRALKRGEMEEKFKEGKSAGVSRLTEEIHSFTGWLLAFYLIYYFVSIYAISKDFGIAQIPYFFYIYKSAFLKYFLVTLFLFHSAISLKIFFFRKSQVATLVMSPIFLIVLLLIFFNF